MNKPLDTPLARLDDYVRNVEADSRVSAYEEDLFARALAGCAPELKFRADFGKVLRAMQASGTVDMWLTAKQAQQLVASKARVLTHVLDMANPTAPDLSTDFDILITKVPVDLTGIKQLDVEVMTPDGRVLKTMPEVSFDPDDQAVYACCEAPLARAAAQAKTVNRVWATDEKGRRLLATIRM